MNDSLPRRGFLRLGTVAAMTALSRPMLQAADEAAPAPKRRLKKAIMYATVGVKGSVLEKFQAVREAGFAGVEPMSHMDQDEVLKLATPLETELCSVCCGTHWAKPLSDPNPAVREQGLDGLRQSLRDAKRYGATSVLLVPAVVNKQVSYTGACPAFSG